MKTAFGPWRGGGGVGDMEPLSAFAPGPRAATNTRCEHSDSAWLCRWASVTARSGRRQLVHELGHLESLGVDALFVAAGKGVEPITALAALAPVSDLVLGAVVRRRVRAISRHRGQAGDDARHVGDGAHGVGLSRRTRPGRLATPRSRCEWRQH